MILGVEIWEPANSDSHFLPREVIIKSTTRKVLHYTIKFDNLKLVMFTKDSNLPDGMVFVADICPYSIHGDKVGTLGF